MYETASRANKNVFSISYVMYGIQPVGFDVDVDVCVMCIWYREHSKGVTIRKNELKEVLVYKAH